MSMGMPPRIGGGVFRVPAPPKDADSDRFEDGDGMLQRRTSSDLARGDDDPSPRRAPSTDWLAAVGTSAAARARLNRGAGAPLTDVCLPSFEVVRTLWTAVPFDTLSVAVNPLRKSPPSVPTEGALLNCDEEEEDFAAPPSDFSQGGEVEGVDWSGAATCEVEPSPPRPPRASCWPWRRAWLALRDVAASTARRTAPSKEAMRLSFTDDIEAAP